VRSSLESIPMYSRVVSSDQRSSGARRVHSSSPMLTTAVVPNPVPKSGSNWSRFC